MVGAIASGIVRKDNKLYVVAAAPILPTSEDVKIPNGKAKYVVLVSKKGLQDRDKKRMQDAS